MNVRLTYLTESIERFDMGYIMASPLTTSEYNNKYPLICCFFQHIEGKIRLFYVEASACAGSSAFAREMCQKELALRFDVNTTGTYDIH